jgi:UDP-N-acetylmuramyl pentapeptide synthase
LCIPFLAKAEKVFSFLNGSAFFRHGNCLFMLTINKIAVVIKERLKKQPCTVNLKTVLVRSFIKKLGREGN